MTRLRYSQHRLAGSLLRQITLLVLLTTTVLLIFFGWQRIQTEANNLTRALHLTVETNSQWLATALALPLYNYDDETVTAICDSLLTHPDIIQVVVNANGQTDFYPYRVVLKNDESESEYISVERDILYRGIALGDIIIYASTKELRQKISHVTSISLIQIVALDFFLVVAMLFFISRTFIKPMEQLQQASDCIAGGDLQQVIKIKSRNELGVLANNLETMRITIQEKISALEAEVEVRLRVEKELLQAKSYIDNIINSMPSLLVSVDLDLRVTQWNKQAEQNCGVKAEDAIGKKLDEVCPQLIKDQERIIKAIDTRKVLYENARISTVSDLISYEDITIYPLVSDGAIGAVLRIDDVTKENRLRSELAHSRKLDAIGQLAGGVAHDFNNMLGGILGGAELLKRHMGDGEKENRYLDIIIQSGSRAADLTEKLLAFARKGKTESTPIDVVKTIHEAVAILQHTLDKRVEISITTKANNPVVMGDLGQLQNVLINLGINAGHAMPDGGKLSYTLETIFLDANYCAGSSFDLIPGQYLDIGVSDSGAGIPATILPQIFEPFFTTKKQGEGTGLGLAAVYGTIQEHNGAIIVYSELGQGTVFHIYLPIVDRRAEFRDDSREEIVCGSGKILVIDDEQVIRVTAQGILESLGYTVVVANNGREGLARFEQEATSIDLVIMDMIMPEMNGEESFYAMQKIDPKVKVLLASGFSRGADIEQLKKDGLQGFINKPFTVVALSKAVASVLQ